MSWNREQETAAADALAVVMAQTGNAKDAARAADEAADALVREQRETAGRASCGLLLPGRWGGTKWPCVLRNGHDGEHCLADEAQHLNQHPDEMTRDRLVFEMSAGHRAARDARDLIATSSAAAERATQQASLWQHRAETLAALRHRTKTPARGRSKVEREVAAWADAQVESSSEQGA